MAWCRPFLPSHRLLIYLSSLGWLGWLGWLPDSLLGSYRTMDLHVPLGTLLGSLHAAPVVHQLAGCVAACQGYEGSGVAAANTTTKF
eukprot:2574591-Amphidinium_carterae.1